MKRKTDNDVSSDYEVPQKKLELDDKAHKTSKNTSLYRPPTSEEMNSLKETENLFKSSLIRMQITELLNEVKPKRKKSKALDAVLHELNSFLLSLPDGKEHEISDHSWLPKKVKFPLPKPPSKVKGTFKFIKPSSVNVVGSYVLGTLTKPDFFVDVIMEMPKEFFQPKDCLNLRYHHKRALYLTFIAAKLIKSKTFASVKFTHFIGDQLKPILLLKPKGKAGKTYTIKLYPVIRRECFKEHRFSPNVNNIRQSWWQGSDNLPEQNAVEPPTPHYNASILSDSLMESHLKFLYKTMSECPVIADAVILINVWMQQRDLSKGKGSFGGYLSAMVLSHLFTSHKINSHMSSYQLVRVFFQFIAITDWMETGIEMKKESIIGIFPSLSDFHSSFDVVFVGPSGYLNLCANMTKDSYIRLKHEAMLAMGFLDNRFLDGFEVLFMNKVPFMQTFDQFVCLSEISCLHDVTQTQELRDRVMSRGGDWVSVASDWMMSVLGKGLGKRADMLCAKPQMIKQWSLKDDPPSVPFDAITVGLMVNPEHFDSVLDSGPPADDPKSNEFRSFWGNKSELRRFQDGSILEAVVWPCNNAAERRLICSRVIKHLLERHCQVEQTKVHYISNQLDCLLQPCVQEKTSKKQEPVASTGEEGMQQVIKSYDNLCKQIRSLDLPLGVHSLQGISPVFRGSEVHPPTPCHSNSSKSSHDDENKENGQSITIATNITLPNAIKAPRWCPVSEILLQFETSGKWPDDLEAIQHIKSAFHLKLSTLLSEKCSLQTVATPTYVDVMKNGLAFRIKIVHYREMALLQQCNGESELEQKEIKDKLTKMEREIVHLPILTTTLHSVQQHHGAYSGTVRLAKRWISSHLLALDIPSECIELLVAHLFLLPAPYSQPRTDLIGFLRFLHLLSTSDWKRTPVIVNLNNDLSAEDYQEICTKFASERSSLPELFIATPKDKFDSKWTKQNPTKQVLHRIAMLAKESHALLTQQLSAISTEEIDFKQIFRPPLNDYDVIIRLHRHFLPRYHQAVDASKAISTKHKHAHGVPVVNFDPVESFVKELKEAFYDVAMFFHDVMGGDVVAVVWKPQIFEKAKFKVVNAQYRIPVVTETKIKGDPNLVSPNIAAILEEFEIIGRGLVKTVEILKKKISKSNDND